MRRLSLLAALVLVCVAWSANAQNCGPLGRQLIQYSPNACPNTLNYAGATYAPPPYWSWSTYDWSIVNGTIEGPANSNYISFTAGTEPVTLSLTATDGSGCSYSESVTVQITDQVTVDIFSNNTVCPNAIETAVVMSPNSYSFTNYAWSIENGQIVENNGSIVRYRAGTSGAVRLSVIATGSSSPSCSASGTRDVPIEPPPSTLYTYPSTICTNATGMASGSTYYFDTFAWSIEGDGFITGGANSSVMTYQAGATAGTLTLILNASSSTTGCTVTSSFPITVNAPPPAPQVVAPTVAICNAQDAEASVTNPEAYDSIWWEISSGSFENYQNTGAVVHFRPDVYWTDSVTLTAHGVKPGCQTQTTVQVPVTPGAVIITPGSQTICPGSSITLTAPEAASYSWSTGETTRSITVSAAGNYTANVTYANGCHANGSVSVSLYNATTPTITPSGAITFCEGGSIALTSSPASSYLWSTGETSQSITVAASGNYTVTTTDGNGCSKTSAPASVTVHDAPAPTITPSSSMLCPNGTVTLTASAADSYSWSTGETTQSITVDEPGSYSVSVQVNGCNSASSSINLSERTAGITASGTTTFCQGGSVTLTATEGASYVWSTGATTQSIDVTSTGNYSATITFNDGCSILTAPVAVSVGNIAVSISSDRTVTCPNGSIAFSSSVTGGPAASYQWHSSGGAIIPGATSPALTLTPSSGGYVYLEVTDANGCSATSAPVTITVNENPVVPQITATSTAVCPGATTTLTAPAGYSYTWSNGAISQSISVGPGSYWVTVRNASNCSATSATTVVTQKTTTAIVQPSNKSVPRNQQTTLSVSATGTNLTYRWYEGTKGNTTKPLGTSPTQLVGPYSKKGTYPFWVRVTGDCGAVDSNTVTLTVTN